MIARVSNVLLIVWITLLFYNVQCDQAKVPNKDPCTDLHKWVLTMDNFKNTNATDIRKICTKFTCITKCCHKNEVHFVSNLQELQNCHKLDYIRSMTNYKVDELTKFDYSELEIFKLNAYNNLEKTNRTIKDMKVRFNGKFYININACSSGLLYPGTISTEQYFFLEDGTLVTEIPNSFIRYPEWNQDNFCFEYLVHQYVTNTSDQLNVSIHFLRYPRPEAIKIDGGDEAYTKFKVAAFIISSIFLLLVLVVYGSLKELRNIGGMVQMAYCGTYMLALILNATLNLINQNLIKTDSCREIMIVNYYLLFASFFWLNIMAFDIWWSFRGWYKQRKIHRQGELVKFGWYALYAWGTPLLITTAVSIIDNSDLSEYPYILKPFFQNCFQKSTEIMFYYDLPIGILLSVNCLFFLLTAYAYWRIKQNLAKFTDSKTTDRKLRFIMYCKLAVIMGVGWAFDVIPMLPFWLEVIASIYNSLTGVFIFFIFVFKRTIFIKFCQRYGLQQRYKFIQNMERRWSTSTVQSRYPKKKSIAESELSTQMETRTSTSGT